MSGADSDIDATMSEGRSPSPPLSSAEGLARDGSDKCSSEEDVAGQFDEQYGAASDVEELFGLEKSPTCLVRDEQASGGAVCSESAPQVAPPVSFEPPQAFGGAGAAQ